MIQEKIRRIFQTFLQLTSKAENKKNKGRRRAENCCKFCRENR